MMQGNQEQGRSKKDGSSKASAPMHHGAVVPPLPHVPSHQPKRYKATGTARVYGAPGTSQRAHRAGAKAPVPAVRHESLPAGGAKAHGVVSLKKSKFTLSAKGHTDRSRVPLIVLCALVVLIVAGVGWVWFLRPVHITVNDQAKQVRIGTSLDKYLADNNYFDAQPGKLLSVGGNVIDERGGDRCAVSVNGKEVKPSDMSDLKLEDGNAVTVGNGADTTEEHTEETVDVAPGIQMDKGGAIQFVSQWGKAGKKKVWHGKTSGETVDKEVVQEATDMKIASLTPKPSDGGKYIALTFDDGPSSYTQQILDILAQKGVHATFFNLGNQASGKPELTRAVLDGGHELASHTNRHQDLPTLGRDDLRSEITSAFDTLEGASGKRLQMIRAPYGAFTDVEWARSADLISCNVLWNIDTLDWKRPGAAAITDMVLSHAFNGSIVLMHDGGGNRSQDVEALPDIIDKLKAQGYTFLTVSELMAKDSRFPKDVVDGTVAMPKDAVLPEK